MKNQPEYFWLPYLHFGYLPPERPTLPFSLPADLVELPGDFYTAARQAGCLISQVIHESITPGKLITIPLSGGLDSRALLSAALEAGADVETLTFGVPGSLDYEYGNQVAKVAGCRHRNLNLLDHLPDTEELVKAVRNGGGWTYTFDVFFNRLLSRQMGSDAIMLHGFLGDPIAGSHYKPQVPDDNRAVAAFLRSERFAQSQVLYQSKGMPEGWLPAIDNLPGAPGLTAYERLDFFIRQVGAIQPIVIDPTIDIRTPFANPVWLQYMLSAPHQWRRNCRLYEGALALRWPELFRQSTKNYFGLGLGVVEPIRRPYAFFVRAYGRLTSLIGWDSKLQRRRQNYIDYATAFREPGMLGNLAVENLTDLNARGVLSWLNPLAILSEHKEGKRNYERELQVLIGLEINLKATL